MGQSYLQQWRLNLDVQFTMKEYLNLQKLFPEKMVDLMVFHEIAMIEMDFSLLEIITK